MCNTKLSLVERHSFFQKNAIEKKCLLFYYIIYSTTRLYFFGICQILAFFPKDYDTGGMKSPNDGGVKVKTTKANANAMIVKSANVSAYAEQVFAASYR